MFPRPMRQKGERSHAGEITFNDEYEIKREVLVRLI